MAKRVRGYSVCPNLMLTLCPGILYSLIGPARGLASCKQSDEQAATWPIIRQGGAGIDRPWGSTRTPQGAQKGTVPPVASGESKLTFRKKPEVAGLVSTVASIVKLSHRLQ